MQVFFRLLLALGTLSLLLQACSSSDKHARLIPENALGVFSLRLDKIENKVGWSVLSNSGTFNILGDTGDSAMDLRATGIALNSTVFSYGLPNEMVRSGFVFYTLIPLKDEKIFETFLKEKFEIGSPTTFESGHYAKIDDYTLIGWNKHLAILVVTNPEYERSNQDPNTATLLTESLLKAFKSPEEHALLENKKFAALLQSGYDVGYWFNYEAFANAMSLENRSAAAGFMSSQKKLIEDSYLSGGFNFEKGKIRGSNKFYFNPNGKGVLQSLLNPQPEASLLSRIPGDSLNLLSSLHLKKDGLSTLIDSMGMLPLVKLGIQEAGLDPSMVLQLLDGDFLLTVVDFNFENFRFDFGEETSAAPFLQAALTFTVQHPATLTGIMEQAVRNNMASLEEPGIYRLQNGYFLAHKEQYVVLSLFKRTARQLIDTNARKTWTIPQGVNTHAFSFYFDIRNTLSSVKKVFHSGSDASKAFDLLEDIRAYSGDIESDHLPFHYEINFQNKKENSLIQLISTSAEWQAATR